MTHRLPRILTLLTLIITCLTLSAHSVEPRKERMVLLPVQGDSLSVADKNLFQGAIKEGLAHQYEIFSGDTVQEKLKKISTSVCTSDECLKSIAVAFNGSLVGRGFVDKDEKGNFFLRLEIKDVITDKDILTRTEPCEGCSKADIMAKLKVISSGGAVSATAPGAVEFANPTAPDKGPAEGAVTRITPAVSGDSGSSVAALFLDSNPSGASVYLGDIEAGQTPYQNMSLKAGQTLRIVLKKDDYHPKTLELKLSGGTNDMGTVALKPRFGSLSVTSEPAGAEVYLAGKKVGETPYKNEKVMSGAYLLSVRKSLYTSVENQRIQVEDEKATVKHEVLSADFGTLDVASTPTGATAEIIRKSGKPVYKDKTPFTVRLSPGTYEVNLEKNGYDPVTYTVTVNRNGKQVIEAANAVMRRQEGNMIVSCDPYEKGAEVLVDGELKGQVPVTLTLPVGEHEIAVKGKILKGKQKILIKDSDTITVQIKIKEESENITKVDISTDDSNSIKVGDTTLVHNGSGFRKKFGLKLYSIALFLKVKSTDGSAVVNADEPMVLRMKWKINFPPKKIDEMYYESFATVLETLKQDKYTAKSNYGPLTKDIDTFMSWINNKASKNSSFIYIYTPGKGTTVYLNDGTKDQTMGVISGLEFKKALFSIWLGEKAPVGEVLKKELLGGNSVLVN